MEILIYMVVRNISNKKELITNVIRQASKISNNFFIVNHGSTDNTIEILESFKKDLNINIELINENFEGTMDDMKGKYYEHILKEKAGKNIYIFIIDWDEVLDQTLVEEINKLNHEEDVYYINRHTYLINEAIDKNSYLPLLSKIGSVTIGPKEKLHKLYEINSNKSKKLKGIMHHYSYETIQDLINKNIFYAKIEAKDLFETNPKYTNFKIFVKFIFESNKYFLYTLIFHNNYLTLEGLAYSFNWYIYKFYKYLFYLELKLQNEKKCSGNM